jgi:hypothetical protein
LLVFTKNVGSRAVEPLTMRKVEMMTRAAKEKKALLVPIHQSDLVPGPQRPDHVPRDGSLFFRPSHFGFFIPPIHKVVKTV